MNRGKKEVLERRKREKRGREREVRTVGACGCLRMKEKKATFD